MQIFFAYKFLFEWNFYIIRFGIAFLSNILTNVVWLTLNKFGKYEKTTWYYQKNNIVV